MNSTLKSTTLLTKSLVLFGSGRPAFGRLLHSRDGKIHSSMGTRRQSIFSSLTPSTNSLIVEIPSSGNVTNLAIETYRDETGKPALLPVVRHIERELAKDRTLDSDYLDSSFGYQPFVELTTRLLFKPRYERVKNNLVGIQTVSSKGALRLGFEFMSRVLSSKNVLVSGLPYSDYNLISSNAGINCEEYPYYDYSNRSLAFEPMISKLKEASASTIVVLQIGHSTGIDPTIGQWRRIAEVVKERQLIPFFDVANIGLLSGSVEDDSAPLQNFIELGIEFFVAQSFSKNFGLYNERVGNLIVFSTDPTKTPEIKQHLQEISRAIYTTPPIHGARIVAKVLQVDYFRQQWKVQIQSMYVRTQKMRKTLRTLLESKQTPNSWEHLTHASGLYAITGLNEKQLDYLSKQHGIYTGPHGRINISAVNEENVERLASAIYDAALQNP